LQEWTRARNQGVALMLLAEWRGDAEMAKLAAQQIEAAFTTMRDGGDAHSAAIFEAQLPKSPGPRPEASHALRASRRKG
jgi:hypothetical protein